MPNAKIVAITNHMDNQGKTTLTYCLAAAKAKAGKMVLMIDLDFQCSLTVSCGMFQNVNTYKKTSSCEFFSSTGNILNCCFNVSASHIDNFFIVPASEQLAITPKQITANPKLMDVFNYKIEGFRKFFDYIFIDVGPAINSLLKSVLLVADEVIVPIKPETVSVSGLDLFVKTVKDAQTARNGNINLKFSGIVINKYRSTIREHNELLDNLTNKFNVLGVIPDSAIITKELEFGLPVTLAHPASTAAKAFFEVAGKI